MTLVGFFILAVLLGVACWVVQTYTAIPQPIKTIIVVVVCLVLLVAALRVFNVWV
jgi:formate hydrogenlyase subunit 3/multisubunit Na+/H+ antiporter MnhD subunit